MKRYLLTILLSLWCACAWAAGSVTVKGRVLCGGRGVEGVWVSDGEEFARTDKRGNYSLQAGADNRFDAEGIQQAIREAGFTPRLRNQLYELRPWPLDDTLR